MANKKASIIIPNYNREKLIIETLSSIQNQDYPNWECIIIDDHSSDNSVKIIQDFISKDARFQLHTRPIDRVKGAGACRNYGFEKATGYYINWFDSDDIMTPDHISQLIAAIETNKCDFAVGDSQNFSSDNSNLGKPYNFQRVNEQITAENFGKQSIGWITDDFLGRYEILRNIKFNELIRTDGDEYNFFTRLLHENNNGVFVNEILTYRRIHDITLSTKHVSQVDFEKKVLKVKFQTMRDIKKYGNRELIWWLLSGYMQYAFKIVCQKIYPSYLFAAINLIAKLLGKKKAFYFLVSIVSGFLFKKGYYFLRIAIKK